METKNEQNGTLVKVQEILRNYKGKPDLKVSMDSKFAEFDLDSLDTVDLVMEIEDQLGVKIEMSKEIETVGHLVKIIDSQIN